MSDQGERPKPAKTKVALSHDDNVLPPARAAAQAQREAELLKLLNPTAVLEKIKNKPGR